MSLNLENSISYLRGEFIPFKNANLSIASSSVLYGMSIYTVFNVMFVEGKFRIFRLNQLFSHVTADFVGAADDAALGEAGAGEHGGVGARPVIAAGAGDVLDAWRAAVLAFDDDGGVVPHAPSVEVFPEGV